MEATAAPIAVRHSSTRAEVWRSDWRAWAFADAHARAGFLRAAQSWKAAAPA